jgi:hypothetical protein
MSAETCAEKTQPTRSINKKKSGCGGLGTVKQTAMTADTADDCCHHDQAAGGLPSSTGCTSSAVSSEPALSAEQPGKRACKGERR